MTETRWLDEREMRMWRSFVDMRRRLDSVIERQFADAGLSSADYEVLVPLSEAPGQVLRARELIRIIGWDRSRLSHQLRRMELRGLLERRECETDARGTMVHLTRAGRKAIEAVAPGHVATVRRYFVDLLSAREVDALTSIATRVSDGIAVATAPPDCR